MASKKERDIEWLQRKFQTHKGKWLTAEAVREYQERASKLPDTHQQIVKERRMLCRELIEEYSLEEVEAINVINGKKADDYIAKYERIRTQTPLMIKKESKDNSGEM